MSDPEAPDAPDTQESATRRRMVWGYVVGGALILVAVLLAWWALADRAAPADPASETPASSASPAPTESVTGAPPTIPEESAPPSAPPSAGGEPSAAAEVAAPPEIDAFEPSPSTAVCDDDRTATVALTFSWRATGADEVWIGVGTSDAAVQPFAAVDAASDGYTGLQFECRNEEQLYTLTARGAGGTTSTSVTVVRSIP